MRGIPMRFAGWAGRLACCIAALVLSGRVAAGEPAVGERARDFQASTSQGEAFTLADFKGQVLVLNFWAGWCAPCSRQLPLLDSYYRLQKKFGLRVLTVANEPSVSLNERKALAALSIPLARNFKGDYGPARAPPLTYVIDRAGILRYAKAASLSLDDLNTILVPLLSEPETPGLKGDGPTGRKMNGD